MRVCVKVTTSLETFSFKCVQLSLYGQLCGIKMILIPFLQVVLFFSFSLDILFTTKHAVLKLLRKIAQFFISYEKSVVTSCCF